MTSRGGLLTVVMKPPVMRSAATGEHQHEGGDDRLNPEHRYEEPVPHTEHERHQDCDHDSNHHSAEAGGIR